MKKMYLLLLTVLFAAISNAQVTGTKTIGVDYPTIAAAVTDLNTVGVGVGGATINVPAGYTETVPVGGIVLGSTLLNTSLIVTNPLVFQKSGAGANPLLTAFTGGSSTTSDGIFKIQGADYVTIDGINVQENAANSGAAFMEWGYALVNLNAVAPFDGCQNITLKNCSITLDRTNPNGAFGIYSAHNIASNTTALTLTAVGDLHSNNKFYTNTISNVNEGFWILGFAAASPYTLYDQNNDVGGGSAATGNTIRTMGVTALFNTFCIYLNNQNGANASFNTIDNGFGGGVSSTTQLIGIYLAGTTSNATANNNNISLLETGGASITAAIYGANTGNLTANTNTIAFTDGVGWSGTHYGIFTASVATVNIGSNNLTETSTGAITGAIYFIYNSSTPVTSTINANTISNVNSSTTSTMAGIYNASAPVTYNVTNNIISNINRTAASGTQYNIYTGSPTTGTFNANTVDGVTFSTPGSTGTIYGIYDISSGVTMNYTNNIIRNLSTPSTGTLYGIREFGVTGVKTIQNNQVYNFSTSAGGAGGTFMTGISWLTGSTVDVSNNKVYSLNSTGTPGGAGGAIIGILASAGTTNNIYKNKVYDLSTNSTGGTVWGIQVTAGTTTNIYNNLIGDLRSPFVNSATDGVRGINLTIATAATSINIYYNTIYLNASSTGANFGASGVFHTTSTTATTAQLTMRNNIIYNNSYANGTGFVAAFRRSSGAANALSNYNAASNNNLFFAGTPSANRLIYYDGTSSAQTLAAYQAGVFTAGTVAPRDAASRTELSTPFLSTVGANANFLHINTTIQTVAESGGANIATFTDDYDGDVRNVATPDIGADEFAGLAVTACAGTPVAGSITGSNNICQGQSTILTLSGYSANSGISIQWQSSAVSGGPYAPIVGETGSTYNTGVIPTGTTVYYVATVTCANGGGNATTVQFAVTSNAAPTIAINPPASTICTGGAGVALTASGALTYTWTPAAGLSATTGATVTANPTVTTTYTVTGTNAAGCTSTANVTVTVNTAPVVTTSATPATICAGANSQLNSTVNLGPPGSSYSLAPLTGQTYTTLSGAGITIINTNGQLTAGMGSGNQDDGGVVITLPFTFSYLGNTFTQMSMCTNGWVGAGNQGTIDAVSMRTSGNLFTSVIPNNTIAAWFKDMGANFPLGTGSMRHGLIGPDVYAFQWDNANGSSFGDGATILISFQVNIYGPASATPGRIELIYGPTVGAISFSASEGIEDATGGTDHYINALTGNGTAVTLSSAWPGNGNGYRFDPIVANYSWSPATFLNSTIIPNPLATAVTATTTYTLTVTSSNGCSTASNVTVTVLSPVVSAVLVQPTTCVTTNGSITLTVSGGTGGVGPYSYAWVGPGVNPTSQNQVNLGVGSYTVTVTDIPSGCTNILTYALPGPGGCNICPTVPTLTTNPTPAVCQNANVTLTASGLTNMGVTYGITFKYSLVALADPYAAGTVIATVPNGSLTAGGTVATTTTTFAAAGNYFIYAILSPLPVDPACRPFATTNLTVNSLPTVNAVPNQSLCRGATTAAINFGGSPVGTVFTWTNNNTAIGLAASGSGNIAPFVATNTTGAAIVATITVTPTFTGGGTTCSGTPTTFTITVNPNLTLVIVAVPGTTLCQGDPAALTVYESTGFAPVTLTQSTSTAITALNSVSCNAGGLHTDNSYWRAYDLSTMGLPGPVTINTVTFGIEQAAGGAQPVTVNLYTSAGAFPGGTRTLVGSQSFSVPNQALTLFTGAFGTPVTVPNTAILVVELFTPSGQATNRSFFIGSNAAAQTGPSYISAAACGIANPTDLAAIGFPNMHIILNVAGTTLGALTPITSGTFLWSPAAGLSSTTTNPVAASPAVTTTYTVVRTTVAGCVGSANITLTVNLRPTVTTQPANATVCATSTATFTVGGTGTGITYQWQESVAAGPFNNITNGGPYSGATSPTLTINPVTAIMNGNRYRCVLGGTCPPAGTANISNPALLTVNGLPVVAITPVGPVCGGIAGISGTLLSTASQAPPIPGAVTVNSGTINLAVPDNTANGVSNNLTVAGIPANATITNVSVTLNNFSHTYPGDIIMHLKAPNNAILNLYKYGTGLFTGPVSGVPSWGWYGSTVSQLGTVNWSTVAAAPFIYNNSTAWKADAINGAVAGAVIQNPTGFVSAANSFTDLYTTGPSANGTWTLAMCDGGPGDVGTLGSWSIKIDYTTPGGTGTPLTYTWSPATGLYMNSIATIPYIAGTQTPQVYAAPTALTVYTATGTDGTTGCSNTASVVVNYTPPAPTITPSSVTMCLGDPAVKLKSASAVTTVVAFNSGAISVPIPDNNQAGASHNITVSGIPANATVTGMRVKMTIPHTFIGDLVIALKAPNNNVLNLDYYLSFTFGGTTTGFSNTIITSAAGAPALSTGTNPYSSQFRADGQIVATANGPAAPTGYTANMASYNALISTLTPANVNGVYTLAMYDGGAIDIGTLTNWEIEFTYVVGAITTPAVWSPAAGLFSDANALNAYVAGTAVDSVWTKPTPSGVYTYTATVQSVSAAPAAITTPMAGGNGNNTVAFNITNNNPIAMTLTDISSNAFASGAITARAFFKPSAIAGNPGLINAGNGWNQFGPAVASNVTAGALNPVLTGLTLSIPAGATYGIVLEFTGATFPAYTNGTGTIQTYTSNNCVLTTDGNVGWGGPVTPGPMANNPRNFNGAVYLSSTSAPPCTSPARTVVVTVNQQATVSTQPVNQTICTDKIATFTAAAAGTGPFTYQWQVSIDNGNTFTNITNGGVYSGATSATLVITAPPVSMNNYQYHVVINGAAPCGSATSFNAILRVNPLPTIVISASPYTRLLPGLVTTLSSTVTPNAAAAGGYAWLRNGVQVAGANTGTLIVGVDGLGAYSLRVTDINGCTNTSNVVTISDSISGKCFIYPNPNSGQFQVRFFSAANNVLPRAVVVYDAKGDKVMEKSYIVGRPYDRMDVDLRRNGKGLYWVEVVDMNGNRLTMCRVVIQ